MRRRRHFNPSQTLQSLKAALVSHLHREKELTLIQCELLAILLGGLILNAGLRWWWADPVAGLVMAAIIAKECVDGSGEGVVRSARVRIERWMPLALLQTEP